jgi:hypothetical protein
MSRLSVNLAGRARDRDAMDEDTEEDADLLARVRTGDDAASPGVSQL